MDQTQYKSQTQYNNQSQYKTKSQFKDHKLVVTDRSSIIITGVVDVISFDLSAITLETICGVMNVKGNDLKVNSVKLEEGEVEAQGCVDSVVYSELSSLKSKGKSVVKRMFG